MAIRDDFEVVASQVRTVVQRFALGLLVIVTFGVMLVGKADTVRSNMPASWRSTW